MTKLLREPLVHFAGAGVTIFLLVTIWQSFSPSREAIIVSRQDLLRMASVYSSEAGTAPSLIDLQGMINDHIETAVLASEARRLGLDRGDVVLERRLAQKMRFMIDDLTDVPTVSLSTLKDWYENNRSKFDIPTLYSFDHVYFRDATNQRIKNSLQELQNGADWREVGDAFMLQRQYGDIPSSEITRLFGPEFTSNVAVAPQNQWVGPHVSTLGTHLVRVNRIKPSSSPNFEDVVELVERKWRDEQLRLLNQKAIEDIIKRYDVHIESIQ